MAKKRLRIALAALRHPDGVGEGLEKIDAALQQAAAGGAEIVCFPEVYLPGLRGADVKLPPPDPGRQEALLTAIRSSTRRHGVAAIVGMEWTTDMGLHNVAQVVSSSGRALGYQAKNQITPGGESRSYVPDGRRRMFSVRGVKFGIVICHEGWRYPETVRWAAVRGAKIVFQPQWTGSDKRRSSPHSGRASFYEMAMVCRAQENAVYFASVNTALRYANSRTSLIDPKGECIGRVPWGREKLLIADIDLAKATRLYAKRYDPNWYPD